MTARVFIDGAVGTTGLEIVERLDNRGEFELILLGEASAYPHGSGQPQTVKPGEVVLMDCGASVHGYQSDISRSFVYGKASARQRQVWDQMRKGQDVAFAAAGCRVNWSSKLRCRCKVQYKTVESLGSIHVESVLRVLA